MANGTQEIEALLAELGASTPVSPTTVPVATSKLSTPEYIRGLSRSYLAGPTFNFGEEIEARLASLAKGIPYEEELATIRGQQAAFEEAYPKTSLGASLVSGLLLNPLEKIGLLGKAAEAGSIAAKATALPGVKLAQGVVGSVPAQAFLAGAGAAEEGERLQTGLLTGAIGTAGSAAASVAGKVFSDLATEADRMKLSAFGLKASDLSRNVKEMTAKGKTPTSPKKIPIVNTLKELENKAIVNVEDDVLANAANLETYRRSLGDQLGTALNKASEVADNFPKFQSKNSEEYINKLSGVAKQKAAKLIKAERDAIVNQFKEGGSILDLQKAKTGLNYSWDANPLTSTVQKAVREDLKEEIETRLATLAKLKRIKPEVVTEVKTLNKSYGDALDLRDAFLNKAGKTLSGDVMEDIAAQLRTSGGSGTAFQLSAQTQSLLPAMGGALLSAARSEAGKNYLARMMEDPLTQALAGTLGKGLTELGTGRTFAQLVSPGMQAPEEQAGPSMAPVDLNEIEGLLNELTQDIKLPVVDTGSRFKIQSAKSKDPLIAEQPEIIQAIIDTESAGKPDAVSKKGAVGLMQLMPATAKELGVDPYDPAQNVEGGTRYYNQLLERFNDQDLALAAYNWGPSNISSAIKKLNKLGIAPTWRNIVDNLEVPKETKQYVSKVKSKLGNKFRINI